MMEQYESDLSARDEAVMLLDESVQKWQLRAERARSKVYRMGKDVSRIEKCFEGEEEELDRLRMRVKELEGPRDECTSEECAAAKQRSSGLQIDLHMVERELNGLRSEHDKVWVVIGYGALLICCAIRRF